MAKPRSVMIYQASLSEALTNDPRIFGPHTFNHQDMPIGHASFIDTDQINCSVFLYVFPSQLSLHSLPVHAHYLLLFFSALVVLFFTATH